MDEVPWFVSLVVAWLPFIVLIWAWVWIGRKIRWCLSSSDGRSAGQLIDEHTRELRRTNDILERLASQQATSSTTRPT